MALDLIQCGPMWPSPLEILLAVGAPLSPEICIGARATNDWNGTLAGVAIIQLQELLLCQASHSSKYIQICHSCCANGSGNSCLVRSNKLCSCAAPASEAGRAQSVRASGGKTSRKSDSDKAVKPESLKRSQLADAVDTLAARESP